MGLVKSCFIVWRYCGVLVFFFFFFFFFFPQGRGGWKNNNNKFAQKSKINVIMRQEELIAQKKREIEAKMAEQAKRNISTPSKPLPQR